MFTASGSSNTPREQCPEGAYPGRIFFIVDLGTQEDTFKGEIKRRRKVRVAAELSGVTMEDGRPFAVGRDFNMNLGSVPRPGEAAGFVNQLNNLIRAITGKPVPANEKGSYVFDLDKLMGGVALFQVAHTEKGNAKMASFMPLPKGMPVDAPVNPPVLLSLDPKEFDLNTYYGLSDWWQKTICASPEGKALNLDKIDPADITRAREAIKEAKGKTGVSNPTSTGASDDDLPF